MIDFFANLLNTADFPARWHCGRWTAGHGWLHILSDVAIWGAYFAIPGFLMFLIWRRRDVPFRSIFLLFGAFILFCGTTHLMEAVIFWYPAYRLAGLIKLGTALVSWGTVLTLVPTLPLALAMRSPQELEREIAARKKAEQELQRANAELDVRVQQRTADLSEANSRLHQEREWLRTTLASIGDAVIATDADGRVAFLNPVAESLTGWPMQDAQWRPLDDVFRVVGEQYGEPAECSTTRVLGENSTAELANHKLLIARDGTERPIEDSAAPIHDEKKQFLGVVLAFRDASEQLALERRRAARMTVTQTLAQADSIEEAVPRILHDVCDGLDWHVGTFWAVDAQNDVLRCQEVWHVPSIEVTEFAKASRKLAFSKGQGLPGRVWETCASEWLAVLAKAPHFTRAEVATREGLQGGFGCPVFLDNAVLGVVEFFSREIREPDADLLEMMSTLGGQIGQFIERKRAQSQLREAEERTRSAINHVVDGIITIDEQGNIETFNPAAERLFGFQVQEIVGQNVKMLMPQPYRGEHDGYIANYLKSGQAQIIGIGREVVGQRKDTSTFPMDLAVSEFRVQGRRYFTGIVRDISERKRNEENLRQIAAQLSEANRRKTAFLATLAHELRNPLAPIRAGLEAMKLAKDDPEVLMSVRDTMERQTKQLITLVDDLLDISRITRGKLQMRKCRVRLDNIVQSAVEASQPFVDEAGQTLTVAMTEPPVYVEADPHRLAQVLSNLLNNAVKYTPEGGRIWLTVEQHECEVLISVKDSGVGIPDEMRDCIFDLFAQIDRPLEKGYTGLGIGLTLVKSLVEMHEGSIHVHSDGPNQGSEFQVRLPILLDPADESREQIYSSESATALDRRRVLVVDDNMAAADMLRLVLKMLGHEVRLAGDGQEAIDVAAEFRPDVILMDIGMPKMNGYEAARHIRQQPWGQKMTLIALTGWGQDEDKERSQEAGFDRHLVKPAEPLVLQRLLSAVERPVEAHLNTHELPHE